MNQTLLPGPRSGAVDIPASKSQAHRLLICAALGQAPVTLRCRGISRDIAATIDCLNALGAGIHAEGEVLTVQPITNTPNGVCHLFCGESGSTLRFLLPVVGLLGAEAVFHMEGRLPQRPLHPLDKVLTAHGMTVRQEGALLFCGGKLRPGAFSLPGDVSSQYISGLLMALPLLDEASSLTVTGQMESAAYIAMTESVLNRGGIALRRSGSVWHIPGGQRCRFPADIRAEGDWSNAAFFLCMGALSPAGISVRGLDLASPQGDRAVLDILTAMGAEVSVSEEAVTVRRGALRGVAIDAGPIPDLIPVLCVTAAGAAGDTQIFNAGRLRLKESDRLSAICRMIEGLGGTAFCEGDTLIVRGGTLRGGTVHSGGDHRMAMAAAVAACLCTEPVTVSGSECVAKSYPDFWNDFSALKGGAL